MLCLYGHYHHFLLQFFLIYHSWILLFSELFVIQEYYQKYLYVVSVIFIIICFMDLLLFFSKTHQIFVMDIAVNLLLHEKSSIKYVFIIIVMKLTKNINTIDVFKIINVYFPRKSNTNQIKVNFYKNDKKGQEFL